MINWMKIRPKTNEKVKSSAHKVSWNLANGWLLCCQPIEYESLSPGLKVADLLYQPLLQSQGPFNSRLWSGIIICCLDWIAQWDFARFFWDVRLQRRKTRVRELLVLQWWLNRGLVRNSSPGLFCFTPRTLEKGGELLKYNFFIFSFIRWLSTFQFFLRELFLWS